MDSKGDLRAMTELEWSSYLSTLIPRKGYAGFKKVEMAPKKRRKAVRRKKRVMSINIVSYPNVQTEIKLMLENNFICESN